jgi:hypothetical protein
MRPFRLVLYVLCLTVGLFAGTVRQPGLGKNADERTCSIVGRADSFSSTDAEAFVAFFLDRVVAGEALRIDWVTPSGEVSSSIPYDSLPASASMCFVSHLPIAGFAPSGLPGTWQVRLMVNGVVSWTKAFVIRADPNAGAARIDGVTRTAVSQTDSEFTLDGAGFAAGSVVHIAQFAGGAWRYIHAAMPVEGSASRIRIRTPLLSIGEYLAVIRDERDRVSNSARFVIATRESYKLPLPAGEPWVLTQGPYGGFSHYGQALHAFDIAPVMGRCLVAMRGGIVHAFDQGWVQNHALRTFGNYITIDHGDGEYSHYAHLQTGSFVVKTGQRVAQGQALARVGNSGYTFPLGGGHHVHVHVTRSFWIASQSIPFEFEDLRGGARYRGTIVSSNRSPYCDCSRPVATPVGVPGNVITTSAGTGKPASAPAPRAGAKQQAGVVGVADWWNHFVAVGPGAKSVEVTVAWENPDNDVDLHLVSPSGKHYGWYGNVTGYSGQAGQPERFQIANPEPGQWRVSVQGMRSREGSIPFRVESYVTSAWASTRRR